VLKIWRSQLRKPKKARSGRSSAIDLGKLMLQRPAALHTDPTFSQKKRVTEIELASFLSFVLYT
jgi:hypothetical protein